MKMEREGGRKEEGEERRETHSDRPPLWVQLGKNNKTWQGVSNHSLKEFDKHQIGNCSRQVFSQYSTTNARSPFLDRDALRSKKKVCWLVGGDESVGLGVEEGLHRREGAKMDQTRSGSRRKK